jgi:hypothetical protein
MHEDERNRVESWRFDGAQHRSRRQLGRATILRVAIIRGVNRLLARGVNLTAMRDDDGSMLCHHVARNVTSEDDFRFLVNVCGNDATHAVDDNGETPLHWASTRCNDVAVRVLIELGAEIDRQSNNGRTALIDAAEVVQSSCVELLLALGADVDAVANDGRTACHLAARWGMPASLRLLVAAGGDLEQPNKKGETLDRHPPHQSEIRQTIERRTGVKQ